MTFEERLDRIGDKLVFVATLQHTNEEHIGRLIEKTDLLADQNAILTTRTVQAMDAIRRLARIADNHEDRLEDLEDGQPS
jgi:hypothetical protein